MELHQIRYFVALCEEWNFTRAAKRCGVSQPSLTRAIKGLETELGGPLFERSRKMTRLSGLGRAVQHDLTTIEQSVAAAKREATRHLAARSVEIVKPQERSMRKVYVGAAIAAALLLVVAFLRPPVTATASMARLRADTVDVYKLHSTIDAKALPTQQVDSLF